MKHVMHAYVHDHHYCNARSAVLDNLGIEDIKQRLQQFQPRKFWPQLAPAMEGAMEKSLVKTARHAQLMPGNYQRTFKDHRMRYENYYFYDNQIANSSMQE